MPKKTILMVEMQIDGLKNKAALERLNRTGTWLAENGATIDDSHLADLADWLEDLKAIVCRARAANQEG